VKAKLEAACPNTVSCADDLTLMARDAVVLAKGPFWPVALGRRDGKVSSATEAADELPPANGDIPLLAKIFASKNLDIKDLVVLSGAHTLGTAHCPSYAARLYNFSSAYNADPTLDSEYADRLRTRCKTVDDKPMLSEMDPAATRPSTPATTATSPSAGVSSSPTPRSSPMTPPGITSSAWPPAISTTCSSKTSASP
jgi:peroxidase